MYLRLFRWYKDLTLCHVEPERRGGLRRYSSGDCPWTCWLGTSDTDGLWCGFKLRFRSQSRSIPCYRKANLLLQVWQFNRSQPRSRPKRFVWRMITSKLPSIQPIRLILQPHGTVTKAVKRNNLCQACLSISSRSTWLLSWRRQRRTCFKGYLPIIISFWGWDPGNSCLVSDFLEGFWLSLAGN